MNFWNLIPWGISLVCLIVSIITLYHNMGKDRKASIQEDDRKFDGIKESLLKANMKLDQVCSTTNETRTDIKSLNKDLTEIDRRVSMMERDIKTAFSRIDDLKERMDSHD